MSRTLAAAALLVMLAGMTSSGAGGPVITSVSPSKGSFFGGTRVTITGANFASGAAVKFGTTAATAVSVISSTSIVTTAPATVAPTVVTVTVTNPDGQSATSASTFLYTCVYSAKMPGVQTVESGGRAATTVSILGTYPSIAGTIGCGGVLPTSDVSWIQITPLLPSDVHVNYESFSYAVSANAAGANRTGHITLDQNVYDVLQAGTASLPPFGLVDTPADNSTGLYGSIAVTGWALDDVEVREVQIWRDPNPADPAAAIFPGSAPQSGKVFIGDATQVTGARPDVEALYPSYPFANRAGWGYLDRKSVV